ncbi:MAG: hypothetical protein HZA14_06360 [Nitrospirae bacterium]|nr:hypothetical protein [Nitrospirota bacterium]
MIDASEKEELLRLADSSSLKDDMQYLSAHRHNPLIYDGQVSMDRLLDFLNAFNEFINHEPKPFKPMLDADMRL